MVAVEPDIKVERNSGLRLGTTINSSGFTYFQKFQIVFLNI